VATAESQDVDAIGAAFTLGEDTALKAAYDAHGSLVYTFCRRAVGSERAKDVTQEVFVSAWRARRRFDPAKGPLVAWLMGIAKNRLIDSIPAGQRPADRRVHTEPGVIATEPQADRVGDRMLVAHALAALPERSRTVIELAVFQDLTHKQIAAQTSLPLGTVKSDMRRGLAKIRTFLETPHD
jgi:RNA polymerase sigma-70 factor (ECF subfamily)